MLTVEKTGCWAGCWVSSQCERSAEVVPALTSSMNALVGLSLVPTRNSLILIGLMLRTFSAVVSRCLAPVVGFVHEALPSRSPLKPAGPEVTVKVALTVAPAATESNLVDVSVVPGIEDVHSVVGR